MNDRRLDSVSSENDQKISHCTTRLPNLHPRDLVNCSLYGEALIKFQMFARNLERAIAATFRPPFVRKFVTDKYVYHYEKLYTMLFIDRTSNLVNVFDGISKYERTRGDDEKKPSAPVTDVNTR